MNKRAIEASDKERPTPDLRTGDIVQIKLVNFVPCSICLCILMLMTYFYCGNIVICLVIYIFVDWDDLQEVPENRRRASIYKGIVISKQNAGIHTTIRIRRIIAGIGVEIVFPV